jgi:hypothetical protein
MRKHQLLLSLSLLTLISCAGLTVKPVNPAHDAEYDGVRYFGSSKYLLVRTDGAGGLTVEPIDLPDSSKLMSAHPYAYLSSNTSTLQFTNGVLTNSEVDVDSTVVPNAIVKALEKVAVAAIGGAANVAEGSVTDSSQPTIPLPRLFKIEVSKGHARLIGEHGEVIADTAIQGLHGMKEAK